MKSILKTVFMIWVILNSIQINAQTIITIDGSQLVQDGSYIVLDNSKWVNNGTFKANSGTFKVSGDATDANASLDGSSSTTFYNLEINKSSNNALLENAITIANTLTLTSGHLDINDMNLTISSGGTISGGSSSSYVQTTSTGTLIQEVSSSNVVFPIGNESYTPVTLNNAGTTDDFNVRVDNTVYQDGTNGNAITTDVVDATWYINETTASGSDITAIFQWNGSDELTDFDRTQAFVSAYHTSQWNNGTASAASGSNPYTFTESGISTFSPFVVASDVNVLPVELLYFYGELQDGNVFLSWETATEMDNDFFDVEWSVDGVHFEKIGQVQGGGTTNEPQSYNFLHRECVIGENYYRLRQVDLPAGQAGFDGKFEYTNTINILIEQLKNISINIYPNPATSYLVIESDYNGVAQLFSVSGQLVFEKNLLNNANWDISSLPKGTYFMKIENVVKRILIQ